MIRSLRAVLLAAIAAGSPANAADTAAPAAAAQASPGEQGNPCTFKPGGETRQLDRWRQGVLSGVCASSRWFDGLFGDPRADAESYDETYGRIGVGLGWDELDELKLHGHFRAKLVLPVLGDRLNAVIGRETEETFIDDKYDEVSLLPGSFSDDQDARWYAGLNYTTREVANSRFDVSTGLQLRSPLNPYFKARYRHFMHPREDILVTSRATAFWKNVDGFGVTLALDTDWSMGQGRLLRWANSLTRSETTDGARWTSRLAWYQALSPRSAVRFKASVQGETAGVQPDLSELTVTYRRSVLREWFFLETFGGLFWADSEDPARRCDACATVGVGFEMMFGKRYDSLPAKGAGSED